MTLHCYDAPEPEVDSPVVLVYEPQSHATPVREAAAAAAIAARRSRAQRRRGNRQWSGRPGADDNKKEAKDEDEVGGARVGCLTEILWEDVQRARDLLRLSRRRRQEVEMAAPADDSPTAEAGGGNQISATPALRRLKRLKGRSSSLDSRAAAGDATPSKPADSTPAVETSTMSIGGAAGGRGFGELRRMLRDLVMVDRRGMKSPQSSRCNISASVADESADSPAAPRICQITQFPLTGLDSAAGQDGEDVEFAELRQLQHEAAVQAALVAANQRLLSECPAGRLASRMKRRRTLEFAKSQEKLKSLNSRIEEIRTRDHRKMAPLPPLDTLPDLVADAGCGLSLCSLSSLAMKELSADAAAAPAATADGSAPSPRQLRKFSSLTSSSSAASTDELQPAASAAAGGLSHAGSLDSGFLEIPTLPDLHRCGRSC